MRDNVCELETRRKFQQIDIINRVHINYESTVGYVCTCSAIETGILEIGLDGAMFYN
jgi:hypothetical protein